MVCVTYVQTFGKGERLNCKLDMINGVYTQFVAGQSSIELQLVVYCTTMYKNDHGNVNEDMR